MGGLERPGVMGGPGSRGAPDIFSSMGEFTPRNGGVQGQGMGEASKSMGALHQMGGPAPREGSRFGPGGSLGRMAESSADLRSLGEEGRGAERQQGRVNIFREALKGAAGNDLKQGGMVACPLDSRGNILPPTVEPSYDSRGNLLPPGGRREEEEGRREDMYGRTEQRRREDYGRREEEHYRGGEGSGRREETSYRQREEQGRREEGYTSGRSSQPRGGPGRGAAPAGGSRKSAADRRLEALEIVKNPYDPSLKQADGAASSSRLNLDTAAIPGTNPPAPEPAAAKQANAATGGPDYAALLQYLQYYQKQVGGPEDAPK